MHAVIKILEAIIPVVIELIRAHHPEKTQEEHNEIVKNLITEHLEKK